MKLRLILLIIVLSILTSEFISAQDTLYVYKAGQVIRKQALSDIDSLTFKSPVQFKGTLSDIDGNVYSCIKIGTQIWMAENLRVTHFRTGEVITNIQDPTAWSNASFAAWCEYNNDSIWGKRYGRFYNWNAVNDSRKIAPAGWHIPSDAEWSILENYLIANGYNYDGTTTSNKIAKSLAAKTDWVYYAASETGAVCLDLSINNKTCFSALPAGDRSYMIGVSFELLGQSATWWSSTAYDDTYVWGRSMGTNVSGTNRDYYICRKQDGHSVRCIKD